MLRLRVVLNEFQHAGGTSHSRYLGDLLCFGNTVMFGTADF